MFAKQIYKHRWQIGVSTLPQSSKATAKHSLCSSSVLRHGWQNCPPVASWMSWYPATCSQSTFHYFGILIFGTLPQPLPKHLWHGQPLFVCTSKTVPRLVHLCTYVSQPLNLLFTWGIACYTWASTCEFCVLVACFYSTTRCSCNLFFFKGILNWNFNHTKNFKK